MFGAVVLDVDHPRSNRWLPVAERLTVTWRVYGASLADGALNVAVLLDGGAGGQAALTRENHDWTWPLEAVRSVAVPPLELMLNTSSEPLVVLLLAKYTVLPLADTRGSSSVRE